MNKYYIILSYHNGQNISGALQFFSGYPVMGVHSLLLESRGSVMTIGDAR